MRRGSASEEGTRRYVTGSVARGIPASAYRPFGRTGLVTSTLGFGTYRIDDRTPAHAQSLELALDAGVNLIDTSTNYTDGLSETCIGNVLEGRPRDEVIVVSKVGYVQGRALALARSREDEGNPFPEMVKYMDGCWHCIHPEFIADQLGRSLGRLRAQTVDVYLLHNPEYFFSDAVHHRGDALLEDLRDEFYDRIRRAFTHLEEEVSRGRIRYYGVSSNTFGSPVTDPEATSIERMWKIASEISRDHRFAVVQLPANLFESGPMLVRNNADGSRTALEFAKEGDLAVLVNRPLNAFHQGHLIRLADVPAELRKGNGPLHAAIVPFLPEELRSQSLSRKAIAALVNTPGVACVLNGMRRAEYVEDSLGVMRFPPFETDPELFRAFRNL